MLSQLAADVDDNLFANILNNPCHVLYKLLPNNTEHTYNLRPRRHSLSLTVKTNCNNFINRLLFKRHLLAPYILSWLRFVNCVIKEMMMMVMMMTMTMTYQVGLAVSQTVVWGYVSRMCTCVLGCVTFSFCILI